jgi:glucose-1-phosphate cytidylyltransferase
VADVKLDQLLQFHKAHGKMATVTAVQPEGRFGSIELMQDGTVDHFKEKPKGDDKWINGGFFVLKPEVFSYLQGDMDDVMWEDAPMVNLANDRQLMAYQHQGFWKPMDALRDKLELEMMWKNNDAKWKTW